MSTSSDEKDVRDEWGVVNPEGRMWTYHSEAVARTVAREQRKDLHHRTVTRSAWVRVTPPATPSPDHHQPAARAADQTHGEGGEGL